MVVHGSTMKLVTAVTMTMQTLLIKDYSATTRVVVLVVVLCNVLTWSID